MESRESVRSKDPLGWLIAKRVYPNGRRLYQGDERLRSSSIALVLEGLQPLAREVTR
jgi:hypothetical protein